MKTLILDSSTKYLIIALTSEKEVLAETLVPAYNTHSELFMPELKKALAKAHLKIGDFDRIVVGIGPGKYTGLRIALTVAKMLAWTAQIPLYTVSSLSLAASGIPENVLYSVVMPAKKDYVYFKQVIFMGGRAVDVAGDMFLPAETAEELAEGTPRVTDETLQFAPLLIDRLDLQAVADINELEPNYLRPEI